MKRNAGASLAMFVLSVVLGVTSAVCEVASTGPDPLRTEWPHTDFARHSVPFTEIRSGGPPKDGIPAIDAPRFDLAGRRQGSGWATSIRDAEPVISSVLHNDARAYPLRILYLA